MNRSLLKLIGAFLAIYVIWGSTYLAIQMLMDTLPGMIMVGLRFFLAGLLLGGFAWMRGTKLPSQQEAGNAVLVGAMLLFVGTGAVVVAAENTPSGLLALLVGMEPLWLAILLALIPAARVTRSERPSLATFAALALGFAGVAILAAPGDVLSGDAVHLPSVLALSIGCLSWAGGSLYGRKAVLPASAAMNSAVQMLGGGSLMLLAGVLRGELSGFQPQAVSTTSVLAFLYLLVFGSIVAFSAYAWLIREVDPTLVATHTYVNPVVAVFLGWWLADEMVGQRVVWAALLIVSSVVLVTLSHQRSRRRRQPALEEASEVKTSPAPGNESLERCA